MNTAIAEPVRMLDVPNADGTPGPDSWALISQTEPVVFCDGSGAAEWSNRRSDALLLPFTEAVSLAQKRTGLGDRVALIRNNASSWEWLMLVAEWAPSKSLRLD